MSGLAFIFKPDKSPKYRTVRLNTGQLATLGAIVWFSCSQGWNWMVHRTITVMSCCSNSCCQTSIKLWRKTPDFTPDVASQQTRPQFYRLQITESESHSGMRLSETARDIKHRWWAVVINRMTYYISQGTVEAPIRIGGQLCYSSVANLIQYLFAKNYQIIMQLDKVIAKK